MFSKSVLTDYWLLQQEQPECFHQLCFFFIFLCTVHVPWPKVTGFRGETLSFLFVHCRIVSAKAPNCSGEDAVFSNSGVDTPGHSEGQLSSCSLSIPWCCQSSSCLFLSYCWLSVLYIFCVRQLAGVKTKGFLGYVWTCCFFNFGISAAMLLHQHSSMNNSCCWKKRWDNYCYLRWAWKNSVSVTASIKFMLSFWKNMKLLPGGNELHYSSDKI